MKKNNNKGFSLVELIVVVLIMGIIAVALAPQVMKWVDKARTNSDKNTAKDLKSSINTAIADHIGAGGTVTAVSTATALNSTTTGATGGSFGTLGPVIDEVLGGDYPKTSANADFMVKITESTAGSNSWKVEVTY